ncbi:MarR family transcriptional regulator [Reichenbachiella sp. 5M10]|uniref:MarR family winged helix-turn-helix transcriptional regulator n=1 Tax=Reichenbachiella sp. 5M10 TaxID=1889772 RepID=UPI000C15B750|nr:MarR family transcriptional regulator [Reichenbachiella sp. 5M10]PIB35089.1 MarR family transcriptional regulator [Reichenbachiella sp. 5M10]
MENKNDVLWLENQLCFPLYAASRLTTKLYGPLLKTLDVTYPQYLVLLVLWQQDHQSVSAISKLLYLESNTLTPLLKRLEQKNLITRKRSEADERTVIISLTPHGAAQKKEATCIPGQLMDNLQHHATTPHEIKEFRATLLKLLTVLDQKTSQLTV